MIAHWLNIAGLALNIAGVVILFIWGPPQPSFDEGITVALDDRIVFTNGTKVSDIKKNIRRLKRRHEIMSRVGLGLVLLGFVAQFIAELTPA